MKLLIALTIITSSAFGFGQTAELSFDEKTFQFPDVKAGSVLSHEFSFTNTGTSPLIFSDYKVQCSCTKVIFPKTPTLPGKSGVIQVTFDTKDKLYMQNRVIEIYSNAKNNPDKIRIKVYVN